MAATVYATSVTVPPQARTVRTASTWSPQSGLMYTRPWRSSPLAGPGFSTLPPIISESSEESHEDDRDSDSPRPFGHTQDSPSSSSIVSASTSGYASRNASGSTSALMLVEPEGVASTSSISLHASSSAHGTGTSSHGHGNSQSHSHRPARLAKSPGRRPSSAHETLENVSETSLTPLPRARTVSHGHSRSASFSPQPVAPSPSIPQVYSRTSPRPTSPESESNPSKQPPSTSRDPTSNWMSSSPFGPGMTPKFSRLAMASPAVVMPLSAREYRKRKARESVGNGKEKEPQAAASNHVTFTDNPPSAYQSPPDGVPLVKVSPPPLDPDVHQARPVRSSSGDHGPDRTQPQLQADRPPPKPLPHAPMSAQPQPQSQPQPSFPSPKHSQSQSRPHPSSHPPKHKRPRSRPNTPPRSSPLAAHPPISPKSSAGTFFSFVSASSSDEDTTPPPPSHPPDTDNPNATIVIPPARPRPRPRRRKSYPDRLSNGARLSLVEAMNRLSQESASLHRLSTLSQIDGANRLSVASQASGHTLFYDAESDGEGRVVSGDQARDRDRDRHGGQQRTSVLHTQSLEDLSSTLARTGIEVVHPDNDGDLGAQLDDERKGKRNVRTVRISDTVEVSPPPVPRRRKLTKSRPGPPSAPGPAPGTRTGTPLGTVKETRVQTPTRSQTQPQERRTSLLPWKSKGSSSDTKGDVRSGTASPSAGEKRPEDDRPPSTPTKGLVRPTTPTPVPHTPVPIANGTTPTKPKSNSPTKIPSSDSPPSTSSTTPRKAHRYTFSFLPSPTFHRSKRQKSHTLPAGADLGSDQHVNKGKPKESSVESGTDSTSTSIRTITQGSQSTLTPASPLHYDLTTPASSGRGTSSSSVPMLRRVNAQALVTVGVPTQNEWDGGGSTPSLVTNGSTVTSSSGPRTFTLPSFVRLPGGEPFVPQPSGLKESFTDTSEEDGLEGVHGREDKDRTPRMCMHRRPDQRSSARAETSEEDERVHLHARSSSGLNVSMGMGSSPSPRPGTPSSTLTTATETSGSYVSFSTVPASTTSSSVTSPSVSDKRASVPLGGDGEVCTCTLCGQFVSRPSSSPTRDLDQGEMHPMFTVPLVTVPASPRGSDGRYVGRRKTGSERHLSVPVLAAVGPARGGQCQDDVQAHVDAKGAPVGTGAGASTGTTSEKKTKVATAVTTTITPSPSPPKAKKRRRPQTAPAGTGDATSKFIEDAKAMRARDGSVDGHVTLGVGVGVGTKHKRGESKFKTVLKGLLRWHG